MAKKRASGNQKAKKSNKQLSPEERERRRAMKEEMLRRQAKEQEDAERLAAMRRVAQRGMVPRIKEEPLQENPKPQKKKKIRRFYDYSLLFTVIFLCIFGLIMIYSSSSYSAQLAYNDPAHHMKRQAFFVIVGFGGMVLISKVDYHFWGKFAKLAYVTSVFLQFLVVFTPLGKAVNGKKRWIVLGPIQFQPTEIIKIALILLLALLISRMGNSINRLKPVVKLVAVYALLPFLLVGVNNLSSGIIIAGIVFVMLFVACKVQYPFFLCGGLAILVLMFAGPIAEALESIGILQEYQLGRINVWLNPEAHAQEGGFQVLQGLYAIGSGGLVGNGLGESIQKMGFVPESHNDMIFSIICEELGLFGAVSVILLFLFMIYRFMVIANNAPDLFGAMIVVGVLGHIAIQVILNIAVVTNTIPNTGVTLPFISYGGTSVIFLMAEMGLVLSVSNQIKLEK